MYSLKTISIGTAIAFACLFIIYVCYSSCYGSSPVSKIDSYIQQWVNLKMFSGSVLVARKGKIILVKGYGMANYEHNAPNTPQTKFYLASVGKQFTAMGILKLVQLGKVHLGPVIK